MKTNFSRKTINSYIYLKKPVINNKSADKQVQMMKASNNNNLFQKLLWFLYILFNLLEGNPNEPTILNAKVHEYIWKISEYICPKKPWKP